MKDVFLLKKIMNQRFLKMENIKNDVREKTFNMCYSPPSKIPETLTKARQIDNVYT